MMFLLAARRMARGYSRLRQWLIMLARMRAIAGLVLAVSRPLASGMVGAGGRRSSRHDDRPRRSFSQHAAARRRRTVEARNGRAQLARTPVDARLGPLGADRQRD